VRRDLVGKRLAVVALLLVAAGASDVVVVKREGVRVMKGPRFFGEVCTADVSAGQRLRVLERRGGWARLASPGDGKCWVHESAWLDRESGELVRGGASSSQRDVELAARGFSEAEEGRYRAENPDLSLQFAVVDEYVRRAPETAPPELGQFLAEGHLGGAR
jgi:hypothetical protein